MAMDNESKELVKYLAIAGGAFYVYFYVIKPMMDAPSAPAPTTTLPTTTIAPNGTTASGGNSTLPVNTPVNTPPVNPPPPPPVVGNTTFDSPDYGTAPWMTRVASAMKTAAGGAISKDLDDWAWYYQNSIGGSSISAALMDGIITNAGGDRATLISSDSFVSALVSAKASGLSGLFAGISLRGFGLGY